jgi:hypothetical protein
MTPDKIKHFPVVYDPATSHAEVQPFGTDYDAAQAAYAKAEQANGLEGKLDIALLSADSLETIELTHSIYFGNGSASLKKLLEH